MSLPNALAGRRLWLLGVASLAALLALAVAALGPLQQRALADGHELPPNLAFNLQLIEDSDNIVPAGSELTVRATISHSGAPLTNTLAVEASAADKTPGAVNIFGFSEAAIRVSGSFEWESDASIGSRLNLANAQLVAPANAGLDEVGDGIVGRTRANDGTLLEEAATNGDRGRLQPVAWDGRTLVGLSFGGGGSDDNNDDRILQIYDTSGNRPNWKAIIGSPETGPSPGDNRRASWMSFGTGVDRSNLQPGISSVAVWHEDDDTAWLFVGAPGALQGYTVTGDPNEGAGALYIYKLAYDEDGDLTITQETKMQPTADENENRINPSGYWGGYQHASRYGGSIAVSKDGSTLAVTAHLMNGTGALYVYTRPDGGEDWSDLEYNDGVKVSSVNIPTWGTSASRPFDSSSSSGCAAGSYCARVTALTTGTLHANTAGRRDLQGQNFGIGKIGISADGTTIAVGAPSRQYPDSTAGGSFTGGTDQGIVYIFEAPSGDWSSTPNFKTGKAEIATDAAAATFTEGGHYSVGPDKRVVSATATLRPRASWTGTAENFGVHVDLSDDGSTLAVSSGLPTTNPQFGTWISRSMAYVFERSGSSWSSSTAPDATYTLKTDSSIWAPAGLDLNPAGDTLVFGQIDYQHGTVSSAGRAVVIKKGDGWADATIADTALTATATMWQLVQPFYDATDQATRFGSPLYHPSGDRLVIGASGLTAGTDHPGNIWNWHQMGDAPCSSRLYNDVTTTTCAVTVPDMGKVVIPNGSPDGPFTISGSVKLTRGVGTEEDPAPAQTIRDSLEVTVGKVDEVASVEIGVAPDLKDPTTDSDDTTYPTTLRASGMKTRLQLKILNAGGKATAAGNLASVLVTSTGGKLAMVPESVARGNATSTSCTDLSCQISTTSINAANAANILLELEHNNRPTTARISVQVLSSAGTSLRSEPLEIILAGPAETVSVAEPIVGVLNVDQVGSDDDGNDVDTATGATQDELLLAVSAKDKGGNTVAVPRATNGRAVVNDPDGNRVRSGIAVTFPARKTPGDPITTGCTTTSADGSGGTCPGAAAGDPRRDAGADDNPAIVTSAGLFQVKIDVDAAASSPLKGGEYTVEVTAGGKTGTAKFNVSGGPAADGFDLSGPEGRQAVGTQFTVEATINDSEGNPVPDGTSVTWVAPQTTSGAGRATLVVSTNEVKRTKDGKASNTYLVVGAGSVVIRATAGAGADAVSVQLGGAAPTAEPVNPADALSSRNPDDFTNWLGTGRTSASALLNGLDGISSILLWLNGEWLRYGVVDGREIPGSQNFTVNPGSVLWLSR